MVEFSSRARLYAHWDRQLAGRTRFFAAASVTNLVLARLCVQRSHKWCASSTTLEFLATLGRLLEHANISLARRIESGPAPAGDLDERMVRLEQSLVERHLRRFAQADRAACARTVRQLDRLLSWADMGSLMCRSCACVQVYAQVLRHASRELGRPASFALQGDRVAIGRALITMLRSQGWPWPPPAP